MRFVIFADIQGNPWALDAILARAKRMEDVELVCLGNVVGAGPDPAGAVERLRKRHILLIQGNRDLAALGRAPHANLQAEGDANARRLTPADVAYLRASSPPRRLRVNGRIVLLSSDVLEAGAADLVITPGDKPAVADARACTGSAGGTTRTTGESPFLVLDEDGVRVEYATWDVEAFASAVDRTRHS